MEIGIALLTVLIFLFLFRKPIEADVNEWARKRQVELKELKSKLIAEYLATGLITKEEMYIWEKQGLDIFKKAFEKQYQHNKAMQKDFEKKLLGNDK